MFEKGSHWGLVLRVVRKSRKAISKDLLFSVALNVNMLWITAIPVPLLYTPHPILQWIVGSHPLLGQFCREGQ